jgi:lysophospholipase L1-like esterase
MPEHAARTASVLLLAALGVLAASCGGGSSPTGPGGSPTPPPGYPVSGVLFYDENDNGVLDPGEVVRLPGVTVSVGGKTGQTGTGGRFTVNDVPAGAQSAEARPDSLPPYFAAGAAAAVTVPQPSGDIAVPATLPVGGRNRPNVYLAFGDSITWGQGSSDGSGYLSWLSSNLRSYWGKGDLINDGAPGTKSDKGEGRLGASLVSFRAAYVLILYGTNDYNDAECRAAFPCYTIDALRSMVRQAQDAKALPVLGTIPPVNPLYEDKGAADRNDWVKRMNDKVRAMAQQEGVPIADVYADFVSQATLSALFSDFLHPNDEGYRIMGQSFFKAVTRPAAAASAGRRFGHLLLLEPPSGL